jgi:rubrerythrin
MRSNLRDRLTEALQDEYKARATYRKVIEKFGPVRPFANIVEAEDRHVAALLALFEKHGEPVPEDRWPGRVAVPDTLAEACRNAVEAEQENMAMYDRLLAATAEPDVRRVLENLQSASRDRHLPAFERCLARRG